MLESGDNGMAREAGLSIFFTVDSQLDPEAASIIFFANYGTRAAGQSDVEWNRWFYNLIEIPAERDILWNMGNTRMNLCKRKVKYWTTCWGHFKSDVTDWALACKIRPLHCIALHCHHQLRRANTNKNCTTRTSGHGVTVCTMFYGSRPESVPISRNIT